MGVNKARGGPTTPTTSGTLPTFPQVIPDQEVIPEVSGVLPGPDPQSASTSSRFQISPISDERPANLSFEPKGNGKFALNCVFFVLRNVFVLKEGVKHGGVVWKKVSNELYIVKMSKSNSL